MTENYHCVLPEMFAVNLLMYLLRNTSGYELKAIYSLVTLVYIAGILALHIQSKTTAIRYWKPQVF